MKNKNLFGVLAMAALAFTGCSTDEAVNDYSPENAIQFGTYIGRDAQARASVVTEESLAKDGTGIGVFAYHSTGTYTPGGTFLPNFMNNQQVTGTANADKTDYDWSYNPLKYWPNNTSDYVSFIAYAPYNKDYTLESADGGTGKLAFTVPTEPKKHIDLLWNTSTNESLNMQKQKVEEKVTFTFGHALSRIGFTISAAVDSVDSKTYPNANTSNQLLHDSTTIYVDSLILSPNFSPKGVLDLTASTTSWTLEQTGWQGYTLDYVYDLSSSKEKEADTELQNYVLTKDAGKTKKQLNKDDSYLMVLPQGQTNFTLTVVYRVFTNDPKLDGTIPEKPGVKGSLVKNVIPVSLTETFTAGTAYTYNIILGMTSVKIDVTTSAWTSEEEDVWFTNNTSTSGSN